MSIKGEMENRYSNPLPCRTCIYALEPIGGFSRAESAMCEKYDSMDNMKPYGVLFGNKKCSEYESEEVEK